MYDQGFLTLRQESEKRGLKEHRVIVVVKTTYFEPGGSFITKYLKITVCKSNVGRCTFFSENKSSLCTSN